MERRLHFEKKAAGMEVPPLLPLHLLSPGATRRSEPKAFREVRLRLLFHL
jgi:hypothetical protein